MTLALILNLIVKHWKGFMVGLVSLFLVALLSGLYIQNRNLEGELSRIQAQQLVTAEQIKTQNEHLEKLSVTLKADVADGFLKNQEKHDEQIKNLRDSIAQSNAKSDSLYQKLNSQITGFTDSTPTSTYLRYINVLNGSYQETNDAYGEAGQSLERAKVELEKCNADISSIYKSVDAYNANLNKN